MAADWIASDKLEKAVGDKWGNDAKIAISHVIEDDTPEDDALAEWTIMGDHAIAKFKVEGVDPLLLVQVDGKWKIDVPGYVASYGGPAEVPATRRYMKAYTSMLKRTYKELTQKQAFATVDDLTTYLKAEIAKVDAEDDKKTGN